MTTAEQIAALLHETGKHDPRAAVRAKARKLIAQYRSYFGEPTMPLDIEALASLRGNPQERRATKAQPRRLTRA